MKNLAGVTACDVCIKQELEAAGIQPIRENHERSEVPYHYVGKLGDVRFVRAWYYWVVSCRAPLDIAMEIYQNPIGRKDVRAGGDCGPVSPDSYVSHWLAPDGRILADIEGKTRTDRLVAQGLISQEKIDEDFIFADPAEFPKLGQRCVTCYHVDSQEGLNLLVEILQKHHLV